MVEAEGMSVILWDVDSLDWKHSEELPGRALKNIEAGLSLRYGSIILQHDIFQYTIDGQPEIIKMIKRLGKNIVSMDRCIHGF